MSTVFIFGNIIRGKVRNPLMHLKYRPVRLHDLEECAHCIRDLFAYDAASRRELIALWRRLLETRSANAMIMEDVAAPEGRRIVWFCLKTFVADEYARYLKTEAPPLMGRHLLDQYRAGESPLLDFAQLRKLNSPGQAGLNLLVMNSGSPPHVFAAGMWPFIAGKVVEFTPLCAGGYRLNEMLIEVYDDFSAAWVEGTGMYLRTEYANHYAASGGSIPGESPRPRLYGITQSEANAALGTAFSAIFYRQRPQFGFSPAEQELLQWALFGESDQELACALVISRASVRKRWEGVYAKVYIAAPQLFQDAEMVGDKPGIGKKRHLLSYLRHHLEELRPTLTPR